MILGRTQEELGGMMAALGQPAFRAKQIRDAVMQARSGVVWRRLCRGVVGIVLPPAGRWPALASHLLTSPAPAAAVQGARSVHDITTLSKELRQAMADKVSSGGGPLVNCSAAAVQPSCSLSLFLLWRKMCCR